MTSFQVNAFIFLQRQAIVTVAHVQSHIAQSTPDDAIYSRINSCNDEGAVDGAGRGFTANENAKSSFLRRGYKNR